MTRHRPIWRQRLSLVLAYQSPVLSAMGIAMLLPLLLAFWDNGGRPPPSEFKGFLIPALIALLSGQAIRITRSSPVTLRQSEALLVTTAVWLTTGVLGAIPFIIILDAPAINAILESVSGFTTAGTTMLTGLDSLPRSILLWRSITQWLGGLGILLIILLVSQSQGSKALSLLNAEGVKVSSGRLSLNFRHAAIRFSIIYIALTLGQIVLTMVFGMSLFDAVSHAMTTISTGGFSPHDESIAFYRNHSQQYPHFIAIEIVIILFMLAGGINFYILHRLSRRQISALWDGLEMRLLWTVVGGSTLIVTMITWLAFRGSLGDWVLHSLFEVVSLVSTTGYETMATGSFPRVAKELFLLLMIIGGCAGSTAGGIKLIRVGLLGKFLTRDIRKLRLPPHAVQVPTINGRAIADDAFRQATFVLLLWLAYIAIGGLIVSLQAPDISIAEAYSTVFSAIGVFGPSFVSVDRVIALPDLSKGIFIVGMLAGRLEILPLLVFFNPAAWRR